MNRSLQNVPLAVDPTSRDQFRVNRELTEVVRQLWLRDQETDRLLTGIDGRVAILEKTPLPDNIAYTDVDNDFSAKQTLPGARIGNLSAGNYSEVESDGTLRFNGDGTVWNDINLSVDSLASSGATIMDVITVGGNKFKAFIGTGATTQQADGSLEILHDYKEGTDIVPHLHWMPEDANAGNIEFFLGYRWWNHTDVMPAETVVSVIVPAGGVAHRAHRTDFAILSGAGMTIGSRFVFRLFRNPADADDTYAHYAIALDFGIHYEKDTVGSRQIIAK